MKLKPYGPSDKQCNHFIDKRLLSKSSMIQDARMPKGVDLILDITHVTRMAGGAM